MNSLGASPLLLALIATAASLPFFVFTLPAGALADLRSKPLGSRLYNTQLCLAMNR
jgi:hypothetical protein